jgi:hypothetical protein
MEPEGSLPHLQVSATCLNYEPAQSSQYPHPTTWRSILILSSHLHLGLSSSLFPLSFPPKALYTPLPSLIRATRPANSFFSILSSAQYWVRSTDHVAPHY